jgi:hypothetical protein
MKWLVIMITIFPNGSTMKTAHMSDLHKTEEACYSRVEELTKTVKPFTSYYCIQYPYTVKPK